MMTQRDLEIWESRSLEPNQTGREKHFVGCLCDTGFLCVSVTRGPKLAARLLKAPQTLSRTRTPQLHRGPVWRSNPRWCHHVCFAPVCCRPLWVNTVTSHVDVFPPSGSRQVLPALVIKTVWLVYVFNASIRALLNILDETLPNANIKFWTFLAEVLWKVN